MSTKYSDILPSVVNKIAENFNTSNVAYSQSTAIIETEYDVCKHIHIMSLVKIPNNLMYLTVNTTVNSNFSQNTSVSITDKTDILALVARFALGNVVKVTYNYSGS